MDNFSQYIGQTFDNRYRIEKIIGVGGMAVVFEAVDLLQKRAVAVKMLKEEFSGDTQAVKRFINESKAVSMLSHPNIVRIYDVSVKGNLKFIVMERIRGITLKSYMDQKGALSSKEVIAFSEQILRALEHAHSKGIIHRDIKPQNIMLLKNGTLKVTDFGIAKLPNAETVTMTDKAIGTVYYISPEQASGKKTDQRSDLYSLGILMYEMLTGKLPFTADTPVSVALKQINATADPMRDINPSVPRSLEQFVGYAMEKDPEVRFQSASQMLKYLLKLKANPNIVFKGNPNTSKSGGGRRESNSMFPIIFGVALAFLLVVGVSAAVVLTKYFAAEEEDSAASEIEVLKVTGFEYNEELVKQLKDEHYSVEVKYVYDDTVPKDQIISQNPTAGEKRKLSDKSPTCELVLTVSRGIQTFEMPDYKIQDYREVQNKLRSIGVSVKVEKEYHDTILVDYVIRTEPEAGTELNCSLDTVVTIHVSQGQEVKYTLVPDFIGKTEGEAMSALLEAELALGKCTYQQSNKPKGTVIDQSLTPSSNVVKGTTAIDFVISGGPDYVPVTEPPVTDAPETSE